MPNSGITIAFSHEMTPILGSPHQKKAPLLTTLNDLFINKSCTKYPYFDNPSGICMSLSYLSTPKQK